jgi:hypothetical protein
VFSENHADNPDLEKIVPAGETKTADLTGFLGI